MSPRTALSAATRTTARPLSTGNLLADCERWCRDHLPHRWSHASPRRAPDALAARGAALRIAPVHG